MLYHACMHRASHKVVQQKLPAPAFGIILAAGTLHDIVTSLPALGLRHWVSQTLSQSLTGCVLLTVSDRPNIRL